MAASVEMRNPFLDTKLTEFAFSLPGNWKVRGGFTKYLTKKLAERFYPRDFIYRPKKGFGVPLDKWIKKELKETFSNYLHQKNDIFNQKYVNKLYREHMDNTCNNQFKLLRIFAVNYWLSKHG
jgi:asparagine synthase (glutamine-hydrolysing)